MNYITIDGHADDFNVKFATIPQTQLNSEHFCVIFSYVWEICTTPIKLHNEIGGLISSIQNKYPKVTMRAFSATGKKDILDKYSKDIKVLSIADIKNICEEGAALSKAKEDFKGYSESVLTKTDKAIGKTPKSKKEGEQDRLNALYASSLSSVNVSALRYASDMLLGYVATLKNLAYLAQVSMAKYEVKK